MTHVCPVCGREFEGNTRARFCGPTCRAKSHKAKAAGVVLPLPTPAATADVHPLLRATMDNLAAADRLDTPLGLAAVELAYRMSQPLQTGSSVAALVREYRVTLSEALKGAGDRTDAVDEFTRRLRAKTGG